MANKPIATTKVFETNRMQAVRLPKGVDFPPEVRDVSIRRVGRSRMISPANELWDDFFDAPGVDLGERDQPAAQDRESL
ncbi:type II toxin-antitoxin system VapB family antitoxin [Sphingomonas sp. PAMC 26605]|uniref:type II toxin-antitoxin system VapB family antitoxin n=1 Tax=Sphingomonas sp. PAMC 26605 TaxID=1112214 RepID=UPI00026CB9AB|nr:type II toxin-antitoxin system VapB family antitoxin [Sphingomonas sp. PAMC 26605]